MVLEIIGEMLNNTLIMKSEYRRNSMSEEMDSSDIKSLMWQDMWQEMEEDMPTLSSQICLEAQLEALIQWLSVDP